MACYATPSRLSHLGKISFKVPAVLWSIQIYSLLHYIAALSSRNCVQIFLAKRHIQRQFVLPRVAQKLPSKRILV